MSEARRRIRHRSDDGPRFFSTSWNIPPRIAPLALTIGQSMFGSRERLYNTWVRDHYRFLFRSAWALTGSRVVAEDVVQDCFELAWRHMDQLRDRAMARPWLFQICDAKRFAILRHPRLPLWNPMTKEWTSGLAAMPLRLPISERTFCARCNRCLRSTVKC